MGELLIMRILNGGGWAEFVNFQLSMKDLLFLLSVSFIYAIWLGLYIRQAR
jgi:hypothetical protein